jgi:hypothetical protein
MSIVDLSGFTMRQIVKPFTFIKEFSSRELSFSIGFVISYLSAIKTAVSAYEQSLVTLSYSIIETSLIN